MRIRTTSARVAAVLLLTASSAHAVRSDPTSDALFAPLSYDVQWTTSRPDGHAPIGVMGDHVHHAGEWMWSYRWMRMDMDGNRAGTDRLSPQEVLALGYPVTPTSMTMNMHSIGAMYAVTDDVTLVGMLPFLEIEMDHLTAMAGTFTTRSDGLGDVKLAALWNVWEGNGQRIHLHAGLSAPTGSIDEKDVTPASMGAEVQLSYPMQLGSGTWDLLPGITYLGQTERWSWGAQAVGTIRTDENDRDYRLGSRIDASAWAARRLGREWSASLRLVGARWADIHGADSALNPAMVPTADPKLRGGKRVDLAFGLNFTPGRKLAGNRVGFELQKPVWQELNGPQLETDTVLTFGWQYSR